MMTSWGVNASSELLRYLGRTLRTMDGEVLGTVCDALADPDSGAIQWLVIRCRGLATRYRAVPVGLTIEGAGELLTPTSRTALNAGPRVHLGAPMSAADELALRAHWAHV